MWHCIRLMLPLLLRHKNHLNVQEYHAYCTQCMYARLCMCGSHERAQQTIFYFFDPPSLFCRSTRLTDTESKRSFVCPELSCHGTVQRTSASQPPRTVDLSPQRSSLQTKSKCAPNKPDNAALDILRVDCTMVAETKAAALSPQLGLGQSCNASEPTDKAMQSDAKQ